MFSKTPELQVICEVSDGLEAVQKAEELQPDLILLDIGLPTLNGIEVARRIRKLAPKSKILFMSQESSADVVQEAFSLGAWATSLKHMPEANCSRCGSGLSGQAVLSARDYRVTMAVLLMHKLQPSSNKSSPITYTETGEDQTQP